MHDREQGILVELLCSNRGRVCENHGEILLFAQLNADGFFVTQSQDQQETRRSQDKLATVGYVIKKHSNQTKFVVQDNPLSPSSGGGSPRKKLDGVPSLKK